MGRTHLLVAGALLASLVVATSSLADDNLGFNGPGWYLTINVFGVWVIDVRKGAPSGPFPSKSDCDAQHGNNEDVCAYFATISDVQNFKGGN